MHTSDIRQYLINRLIKLNKKAVFLLPDDTGGVNRASLKSDIQQNLNNLKLGAKIFGVLCYCLLTITGGMALVKVFGEGSWPDLNKGALLIFLTVTNTITAFIQKLRIERLEKQILLLDILENMDEKNNPDKNSQKV